MPFFSNGGGGSGGMPTLSGVGAPSDSAGVDGQLYLDTATKTLYGPKAAGSWGAGIALTGAAWGDVTGKPATFTATAHAASHASGGADAITIVHTQVSDFTAAVVAASPATTDAALLVSGTLADARLSGNVVLTTDARLTNGRTAIAHAGSHIAGAADALTLSVSQITGLQAAIDGKAATSHAHAIADVTGLQTAIDGKQVAGSYATASHAHIIADVTGLQSAIDGKQSAGSYAATVHAHAIADVTGLQTAIDGKAPAGTYATLVGGTVPAGQLATGTASATTFLRGDGAWSAAGGSTDASLLSSGTVDAARLPLATTTAAGAVIVGSGLTITAGVLSRGTSYDPADAPDAPSGIYYQGGATGDVIWTASPGGVAVSYELQSTSDDGATYSTVASGIVSTSYQFISGFKFRVRGFNADNLHGEWGYQEGILPPSGGGSSSYVLPTATDLILGGVKVGAGLSISAGVLSATGGGGGSISSSGTVGNVPTTLAFGSIFLNYADGVLYYKNSLGAIVALTTGTPGTGTGTGTVGIYYLMIGGGGGGGAARGAGGGAGGFIYSNDTFSPGVVMSVVVGAYGAGTSLGAGTSAQNGGNSTLALPSGTVIALGGGRGADGLAGLSTGTGMDGGSGGSGGGGSGYPPVGLGGTGAADQGYAGGAGWGGGEPYGGGGGGGAGGALGDGFGCPQHTVGSGGAGGGGSGSSVGSGSDGAAHTGGGGGGGKFSPGSSGGGNGGNGGSGLVVLRLSAPAASTTGSPSVTMFGEDTIYTFYSDGSLTV